MKKFEYNGFTATVTDKTVKWEIPINNLVDAFLLNPNNSSDDEEYYITIKKNKKHKFAEYVAKTMFNECDYSDDGASYIEYALDGVFETILDDYMDFADYPD